MSYGSIGYLQDIEWCSSTHPLPACANVGGVATPNSIEALNYFKQLQRNVNRLLAADKQPLIAVDGRIGRMTTAALQRYWTDKWPITKPEVVDVDAVAYTADVLTGILYLTAVFQGAPIVPDPTSSSPPSTSSGTRVVNPTAQQIRDANGGTSLTDVLKTPLGMAAAVVGVLLISRAATSSKRKGKKR